MGNPSPATPIHIRWQRRASSATATRKGAPRAAAALAPSEGTGTGVGELDLAASRARRSCPQGPPSDPVEGSERRKRKSEHRRLRQVVHVDRPGVEAVVAVPAGPDHDGIAVDRGREAEPVARSGVRGRELLVLDPAGPVEAEDVGRPGVAAVVVALTADLGSSEPTRQTKS